MNCLSGGAQTAASEWAFGVAAILAGLMLASGFLTPLAGALVAFGTVALAFGWFPQPVPNLLDAELASVFVVIISIAVTFLGPGAYSVDARLFGRREIIIPQTARSTKK
ncbi:MAG: hypothetical protein ABI972_04040 [Acidobacteriota bacterium]